MANVILYRRIAERMISCIHQQSDTPTKRADQRFTAESDMVTGRRDEFNAMMCPRLPFTTRVIVRPLGKEGVLSQNYGYAARKYFWRKVVIEREVIFVIERLKGSPSDVGNSLP